MPVGVSWGLVIGLTLAGLSTASGQVFRINPKKNTPPASKTQEKIVYVTKELESPLDPTLERRLKIAWLTNPVTFPLNLGLKQKGGKVFVTGFVPNNPVKQQVLKIASKESGLPIQDGMRILPGMPVRIPLSGSKDVLKQEAINHLEEAVPGCGEYVKVHATASGKISLSGIVPSKEEELDLCLAIHKLKQCTCLVNRLQVGRIVAPTQPVQPTMQPIQTVQMVQTAPIPSAPTIPVVARDTSRSSAYPAAPTSVPSGWSKKPVAKPSPPSQPVSPTASPAAPYTQKAPQPTPSYSQGIPQELAYHKPAQPPGNAPVSATGSHESRYPVMTRTGPGKSTWESQQTWQVAHQTPTSPHNTRPMISSPSIPPSRVMKTYSSSREQVPQFALPPDWNKAPEETIVSEEIISEEIPDHLNPAIVEYAVPHQRTPLPTLPTPSSNKKPHGKRSGWQIPFLKNFKKSATPQTTNSKQEPQQTSTKKGKLGKPYFSTAQVTWVSSPQDQNTVQLAHAVQNATNEPPVYFEIPQAKQGPPASLAEIRQEILNACQELIIDVQLSHLNTGFTKVVVRIPNPNQVDAVLPQISDVLHRHNIRPKLTFSVPR